MDEDDPDYVENSVNRKDQSHIHPLFLAVFAGNIELTKALLKQGSDPMQASDSNNVTLLHICAERGYSEITNLICDTAPKLIFEKDNEGNTPLHVVCDWDYLEIIKKFCDTMDAQLELANGQSGGAEGDEDSNLIN